MKIGILTQPLRANYGGILQNYALQQVLIHAGHDVETIDWGVSNDIHSCLYRAKMRWMNIIHPSKYAYQLTNNERRIISFNTSKFIDKYIIHTYPLHSHKAFKKQADRGHYDALIVGSDQCWRPRYNDQFLPEMFLCFAHPESLKIAYAASFGTDHWEFTPEMTAICSSLAQNFDLISVREDSGVDLCKEHLCVDAVHVLDPTMLLSKEDYVHLVEAENEPLSSGSLFTYILDPDESKTRFIQRASKSLNLTPFKVLPKYQAETRTKKDIKKHIDNCVFPGVCTWLQAFIDAEMTIVDSFHGMVFSLIFNKPFWVIGNEDRGMSRFSSFLNQFNLQDRLLDVHNLESVDLSSRIDWQSVNSLFQIKQTESLTVLLNALK